MPSGRWKWLKNIQYFGFFIENNHRHLKTVLILQSHTINDDKTKSKQSLHILESDASGEPVGDIDQVTF